MKPFYLLLITVTISFFSNAQISFNKYFSQGNSLGELYRSVQTSDGGYAAIGHLTDLATFDNDFLIIKIDSNGNALWIKKIATAESEEYTDIIVTTDSGIVVVGSSISNTFQPNSIVMKFDNNGILLWSKSYILNLGSSNANKIQTDSTGNLYVLGNFYPFGGTADYYIMKLDPIGTILQQTTFGTTEEDVPLAFVRNSNGDFFVGGWRNLGIGENIHLIKINSNMTESWNKLMSGNIKYFCYDLKEKSNGNLVMAGRYDDGITSYDMLLSEFDTAGTVNWAKYYSAVNNLPEYAYGLTINKTSGSLALTGIVEDTTAGTLLMETNGTGTINWSKRIGSSGMGENGSGYGIQTTTDGGYLVCGNRSDLNNSVVQLIKTDPAGGVACYEMTYPITEASITLPVQSITLTTGVGTLTGQPISYTPTDYNVLDNSCSGVGLNKSIETSDIIIYPNPFINNISIQIHKQSIKHVSLKVHNTLGEIVFRKETSNLKNDFFSNLDLGKIADGIYLFEIAIDGITSFKNIVKQ